jgi:hypothetical protein
LLRKEVKITVTKIKRGSPEGNNILSIMQQGKLVPSFITCGLLKSEMSKVKQVKRILTKAFK